MINRIVWAIRYKLADLLDTLADICDYIGI